MLKDILCNNGFYYSSKEEKISLESLELVSLIIDIENKFNIELMDGNDVFINELFSGNVSVIKLENTVMSLKKS